MKVLKLVNTVQHGILGSAEGKECIQAITDKIEEIVQHFDYTLPHGWRAIIELDYPGCPEEQLKIDLQHDDGGGSFAEAKMETLRRYPELTSSGMMTLDKIKELIAASYNSTDEVFRTNAERYTKEILKATELNRTQHECIRNQLGITTFNGAFRSKITPRATVSRSDDDSYPPKGEIRVAFSGAKEHEDVMIAIIMLSATVTQFEDEFEGVAIEQFDADPYLYFILEWLSAFE